MTTFQQTIINSMKGYGLPGLPPIQNPFVSVLEINTSQQFWLATAYIALFYYAIYFVVGGILEYTNPFPKNQMRIKSIKRQIMFGISALFFVIIYTTLWYWKIDKITPYYGYWQGRENQFGIWEAVKQTLIYLFLFDTWFYLTHVFLHIDWWMQKVHRYHHSFYQPSAFAQDAVHPFEAILQGPMGHLAVTLVYPMNPLLISVLGMLTSLYALMAHDARTMDLNDHIKHHHYRNCNFGLYWGFWDFVFGTRYHPNKYPVQYIPSYKVLQAKGKKVQ